MDNVVVIARVLSRVGLVVAFVGAFGSSSYAQVQLAGTTYRVFLTSGEPLPSYGEPALIADRVIFNLIVGASAETPDVQLVSLPSASVDVERTSRYVHAMRASHYAATRGEADYAALTAEVARVLDQLTTIADARRRLRLAEDARRQLVSWSADHYHYRADDIRELAALFDDVIVELRIAAGERGFSFDLVAGAPPLEPLLPAPTSRETAELALAAANAADNGSERVEILRKAAELSTRVDDPEIGRQIAATLAEEIKVGTAYASLIAALRTRADAARRRGDVAAVQRLTQELERRDQQLGQRRPAEVQAFNQQLEATVEATRAFRLALDEHTRQLASLRRYDQRVQPLLVRLTRLTPLLATLREMHGVTSGQLTQAETELQQLTREVAVVRPPAAQAGVHATLQSVVRMAVEACARRRQAVSSQSAEIRESSAAAAGALLLGEQVRRDLAASLRRPTIQ